MSRTSTNGVSVLGLDEPLGVWIPNSRTKSRWKNLFTCGAPLDSAVKAIFTAGLLLAWLSILSGTDALIQSMVFQQGFSRFLAAVQIVWGIFFGGSCMFGLFVMWGKWRRSATAALIFTITWVFATSFVLVAAATWYYFFFATRAHAIWACTSMSAKIGPKVDWDSDAPRRPASSNEVNDCVVTVNKRNLGKLVQGIIYTGMIYCAAVVVAWGRTYRNRLLEIEEWENLQKAVRTPEVEKFGPIPGTAVEESEEARASIESSDGTGTPLSFRPPPEAVAYSGSKNVVLAKPAGRLSKVVPETRQALGVGGRQSLANYSSHIDSKQPGLGVL